MTNQDITIYSGDYAELEVTVRDQDGNDVGAQGIIARYKVARHPKMQPMILKTLSDGVSVEEIDSTLVIKIIINPEDTVNMPSGKYYHEIEIRDSNQRPFTVMTGAMTVMPTLINSEPI